MANDKSSREANLLAGPPGYFQWWRDGDWAFTSRSGKVKESNKVTFNDTLTLLMPPALQDLPTDERVFVNPPGTTPYIPLKDTPSLYRDFMALGEFIWETTEPKSDEIIKRVLQFTHEYGPLTIDPLPKLRDVLDEAKTVARLGAIQRAMAGDTDAEGVYWPRALVAYGPGFDDGPELGAGSDALYGFMAVDLERTVNAYMKDYTVFTQIRRVSGMSSSPRGFEPSYQPSSLRGAIWTQFASSLIAGSVTRRCRFIECKRIFEAPGPRSLLKYCPDRDCQIKANDRTKHQRRIAKKQEMEGGEDYGK
jgi:hypothetical protein